MAGTVLIAGASGLFGSACDQAFTSAGWTVRRWQRGTDMAMAAHGADLIVNALNPPNYHAWDRLIPEITETVIAAAKATGATVLVPGNVYVYGTQPGPWGPDTPHRPVARKGHIRAVMEARYREAAGAGIRVIVLRGGDFIAPNVARSILNMIVLKGVAKGRITAFGPPDLRRAHAYLPDMARAAVQLAQIRADLPAFADVPFPGYCFSTAELRDEVQKIAGRPLKITQFPWWAMRIASPFWELARELSEMRYLFDTAHALDGTEFDRLLPGFDHTPFVRIIAQHPGLTAK